MSNALEAFIEYITIIKGLSPATIEAYTQDLVAFEAAGKPLLSLDLHEILTLVGTYDNRRTLNRKLSSINAFFEFCFKQEFVASQHKIKLSKLPKYLPRYLELESIREGLNRIPTTSWLGKRDYALILFLFATGCRVSEALHVEKSDIQGQWVKIRVAKGDKERMVPIAEEALTALEAYIAEAPKKKAFLWQNYQAKPLSRISVFKITQQYLTVSPHVLRHSYATAMILGGADLRVVQELLGHASMLTTQMYTHIEKASLREAVQRYHPLQKEDYEPYE